MTATNVFAHIQNVGKVLNNIEGLLDEKGVFISESHYLRDLIETLQYDTIYHEHLRYYSLTSLKYLPRGSWVPYFLRETNSDTRGIHSRLRKQVRGVSDRPSG